ncbi:D-alanyl-D-alanine carboxypeptidase [Kitasatospora sp. NPDC048540]|uniref:D-alanyl-D-alanine carboxypeptidase family protein n=1 Tax=unclassified Kitasatospora TaxID=2633591 RepID=UPI0009E6F3BB|nr:D-alanyl-D-alanine carboxypeptidase [Kitasatospora sp. MBT63]
MQSVRHIAYSGTALALGLLCLAPVAVAAPQDGPPPERPPVGGELLGRSGVQVMPKEGAPALPGDLTGQSWLIADGGTGEVLASYNAHQQLPPASTLKMLFADVVLPRLDRMAMHKVDPEELMGMGAGSSLVGIKEDLDYRVDDLWRGVFLSSGADAVRVLATMNGGVQQTVSQMQSLAQRLGALDTHVVTPEGYDEDGQVSSAYDLTLFAREGLRNPDFRAYCSTKEAQFPGAFDKASGQRGSFGIANTDRLLGRYPGLIGVKNGYTTNAGATFTGAAVRDGRTLLVTVMRPNNGSRVYDETAELLDWGFAAAGKVTPVGRLVDPGTAPTPEPARPAASPAPAQRDPVQIAQPVQTPQTVPAGSADKGGAGLAGTLAGVLCMTAGALLALRARAIRRRRAAALAAAAAQPLDGIMVPAGATAISAR